MNDEACMCMNGEAYECVSAWKINHMCVSECMSKWAMKHMSAYVYER